MLLPAYHTDAIVPVRVLPLHIVPASVAVVAAAYSVIVLFRPANFAKQPASYSVAPVAPDKAAHSNSVAYNQSVPALALMFFRPV